MPRIAAMTSTRSEQLGHGAVQHEAMSDVILSSATEHDMIEPSVITNPCVWSAGRPGVIRMDLPNPGMANATSHNLINSSIEPQQVVSSRPTNSSGMNMPPDMYLNSLNAPFDQNSNSNLVTFPSPPDSNPNWQISRRTMELENTNLNNSIDVSHNLNSDSNGMLRSMNSGNFSWIPHRSPIFPIDEDGQNDVAMSQMQTSRRMTRAMRRRVMTNDQRQDMELRPILDLNATVLNARPRRSVILTRTTHSSIPNSVSHTATARNSAPPAIRSSSHRSPLAPSLEVSVDSARTSSNVPSSSPPKSVERPVTRKRCATQANITPQSGTRKNTRLSEKRKKIDDNKKIPAIQKETEQDDLSSRCCICLEEPTKPELSKLDMCLHVYCFTCIEKWAERENTCPLCKTRFHKIERVHKVSKPRGKRSTTQKGSPNPVPLKNVKKVKNRDQRSDYGRNMQWQGLLERMEAGGLHHHFAQFIFSGLNALGTPNLMSFDANVPTQSGSGPYPSGISMRIPSRQHSTPQRASTSNNRPTFADFATRSRPNNIARVRSHHQTINDDVTRSLSALRSTLLSHHNESISSPSDTPGTRASFVDFQPPFTHGASEAFGVGDGIDIDLDGDGDVSPRFNRDTSETFSEIDAPIESTDDSEDGVNSGLFYQRIRNLRRERNAVMERFHNGEAGHFLRSSAVFERSAVDGLNDNNSNVFEDTVDRSLGVPRSFAANAHQIDAGGTADTALEIIDSDEEDGL